MMKTIAGAVVLPLLGTAMGAGFVFFMKGRMKSRIQRILSGFASGVMVAASIWSLILPAIEQSGDLGWLSFFPALAGVWAGVLFLLALEHLIDHIRIQSVAHSTRPKSITMLVLAVTLHNLPEGMAVGAVAAGWLAEKESITAATLLTLSAGIALQNLPEGAIISMPLKSCGVSPGRSFLYGVLSGIVEPMGALLTVLLAHWVLSLLPFLLSFAAGAMLYVVVEELIPELTAGEHSHAGVLYFSLGFTLMMVLDVALG